MRTLLLFILAAGTVGCGSVDKMALSEHYGTNAGSQLQCLTELPEGVYDIRNTSTQDRLLDGTMVVSRHNSLGLVARILSKKIPHFSNTGLLYQIDIDSCDLRFRSMGHPSGVSEEITFKMKPSSEMTAHSFQATHANNVTSSHYQFSWEKMGDVCEIFQQTSTEFSVINIDDFEKQDTMTIENTPEGSKILNFPIASKSFQSKLFIYGMNVLMTSTMQAIEIENMFTLTPEKFQGREVCRIRNISTLSALGNNIAERANPVGYFEIDSQGRVIANEVDLDGAKYQMIPKIN